MPRLEALDECFLPDAVGFVWNFGLDLQISTATLVFCTGGGNLGSFEAE